MEIIGTLIYLLIRVKLNLNDLGKFVHSKKIKDLVWTRYCWDSERNTKMYTNAVVVWNGMITRFGSREEGGEEQGNLLGWKGIWTGSWTMRTWGEHLSSEGNHLSKSMEVGSRGHVWRMMMRNPPTWGVRGTGGDEMKS